jgi:hypothetical protein
MATISNTPRPGYVWDSADNVWYPIGVGAHQHTNAADTPAVMPYSTYAAAGKNKIINGDFSIWQRGTSNTATSYSKTYIADRFYHWTSATSASYTVSRQAMTPGAIGAYEFPFFFRFNCTTAGSGGTFNDMWQGIENVQTLAGKTVTFSFWAKADTNRTVTSQYFQVFGSGGSGDISATIASHSLTTSWQRFTATFTYPSISGKTIGTGSFAGIGLQLPNNTLCTVDTTGWQLEEGSTVTAFQTATGNPASELAACQRYYYRAVADTAYGSVAPYAVAASSSGFIAMIQPPATMRVSPTSIDFSTLAFVNYADTLYAASSLTLPANNNKQVILVSGSMTGATAGHAGRLTGNNSTAAYLGFSAEL